MYWPSRTPKVNCQVSLLSAFLRSLRTRKRNNPVAINDPIAPSFPGLMNPCYSGAPGSAGNATNDNPGELGSPSSIGTVGIPVDGQSYRVPRAQVSVGQGDTSGFSDDVAAHQDALMGGPQADYLSTGAGHGTVVSATSHGRYSWQQQPGPGPSSEAS